MYELYFNSYVCWVTIRHVFTNTQIGPTNVCLMMISLLF